MPGHDGCNAAPLCEWKGIFLVIMHRHSLPAQTAASGISPASPLPPSLSPSPRRKAGWCVKKATYFPQIPVSNLPLVPTQQARGGKMKLLGNLTCRPEVPVCVSFAHTAAVIVHFSGKQERWGVGGWWWSRCYNARQRMRLSH